MNFNQITKYEKKLSDCLMNCVSKDETRIHLTGIIHYSNIGALVSCDGHKMFANFCHYDDSLKDKILNPETFQTIKREYPRIETIIPKKTLKTIKVKIEKHHYLKACKDNEYSPKLYFYDDHCSHEKKDNALFCINASFIKPLADGTIYTIEFNNALSPIVFKLHDELKDFMIIMPIKL